MKKSVFLIVASALALGSLSACGTTHKVNEPTLSPMALQELQTREFETTKPTAFAAVLTVLQDAGYIIDSADLDSGFITGSSPTDSNTTYNLFWGFGKKRAMTKVTAFVEQISEAYSKVRLNFVAIEEKSQGYGVGSREDTPLEDAQIYTNVFEEISKAIFVRTATQ